MTRQRAERIFEHVADRIGGALPIEAAERFILSKGLDHPIPEELLYKVWAGGNIELWHYYDKFQKLPDLLATVFVPAVFNLESDFDYYDALK